MAIIRLAEVSLLKSASKIPLVHTLLDSKGQPIAEPWFDYDEEGNPTEFGIDEEPPDPDADSLISLDKNLIYDVSPSQFAETAIRVPEAGQISDFSFEGREYLRKIYDTPAARVLLKCGRQVEKSTTLGNRLLCYSALTNNFRCLFVAPSAEQAKVFSNDRIKDVIEASPLIKAYTSSKINQAVFFKKFINFSQIRLRYAYLTADRVRGIPADLVEIDEIQDILVDNIPIIEQCAFHSKYKLFIYSGTPKSFDNTIEHYWTEFSTQNEWVVPCDRHGTPKDSTSWHWNVLRERNIGKDGLICDSCGKPISARDPRAQWAALQPIREDNREKVTFEGYRIPQIMVPWVDWKEVLEAQEQYSRAQFMNEKLGMSYDSGTRPISRAQVKACCQAHIRLGDIEALKRVVQGKEVFGGVDWGAGTDQSYTVIAFGSYLGGARDNFSIFWLHRFTGQDLDPERQLDKVSQMIAQLQCRVVGVDYGGGFYPNDRLCKRFGPHRVVKFQYNPKQKRKVYWEEHLLRYMAHRSEVMTDVFSAIKDRKIDFPSWEDFEAPYASDILNIFTEYNQRTRMIEYKKAPGKTDDTFHAVLYCLLASMIVRPRPDIITPSKQTGLPNSTSQD